MNTLKQRKTALYGRLFLIAIVVVISLPLFSQFAGGDGSEDSPWQVQTAQHLNNVRNYLGAANNNRHFVQIADIDLDIEPYNEGMGWTPIGNSNANGFHGHYNGGGYVISNLLINRPTTSSIGLFGYIAGQASIKNLGIININVTGASNVGGLVGRSDNFSRIEMCYATGRVLASGSAIGGIVGYKGCNDGQSSFVLDCYSTVNVRTTSTSVSHYAGGVVGYQYRGETARTYAIGRVDTDVESTNVGAVVGRRGGGTVTNIFWNTDTCGQASGIGNVNTPGRNTAQMMLQATYTGFDFNQVWNIAPEESFPFLRWEGDEPGDHNYPPLLPPINIVCTSGNQIIDITWEAPTFGEPDGYNVYRDGQRVNDEPIDDTEFRDTGLTNFRTYDYTLTAIYGERESMPSPIIPGTPVLFAGGSGTADDPYQVGTANQLNGLRFLLNAHFIQFADINLGEEPWNEGAGWQPIAELNRPFSGSYNGAGFKINNMTINRTAEDYIALFGYLRGATISNIALENVNIQGRNYTGGFAGYQHNSTITGSYITGSIRGNMYVGGISGYQRYMPTAISNTYSMARVHSTSTNPYIGGLVGYNYEGTIQNCYVSGPVSFAGNVGYAGALFGHFFSNTTVTNSYWNIEATGQTFSPGGGQGLTASQMTRQGSFTDWNFNQIWAIGIGDDTTYPYHRWQEEPEPFNYPVMLPPKDVIAAVSGNAVVTVFWTPPSMGEPDGYNVYRNVVLLQTVGGDQEEFQDNNANINTTYRYYVTAMYGDDESLPSNISTVVPVAGGYSGGRGTVSEPYQIRTAAQLDNVRQNLNSHFMQTEDINLNTIQNWNPIGTSTAAQRFTGSYNGNGFTISNMTINRTAQDYIGLFGYVGYIHEATLRNIELENVDITGRNYVAGLAGRIDAPAIVDSCRISGEIESVSASANPYVGGLAAYVWGTVNISNSSVAGRVTSINNYTGGLIGFNYDGIIENCYTTANVSGGRYVGGFVGYHRGMITNSFSRGSVTGTVTEIGGFAALTTVGNIRNSYSTGRVGAPQDAANVGGFIGQHSSGTVTGCYWDTQNSGQANSPQGQGRISEQMRHPHAPDTYVDWDFVDIWRNDTTRRMNDGYPYLWWHPVVTGPNPDIATNPQPQHQAANVSAGLEEVSWTYTEHISFSSPVGFRVYMNTTGEFEANHPFVWVDFEEGEENYATSEVLPEELAYRTTYHWKVVPTTIDPDGRRDDNRRRNAAGRSALDYRGDAENVPVWRFTTEINPNPAVATNPTPPDDEEDVAVNLTGLGWTYTINQNHANPAGFRVYLNTTGEFGAADEFGWVAFSQHQANYSISSILPELLNYATTYYWKVVPTTNMPNRNDDRRRLRNAASSQRYGQNSVLSLHRGDAENVPVWSFTTILRSPNPTNATNPQPEHLAVGVSLGLNRVTWDYLQSEVHADPVGFRVYMNTTGAFGANAPYEWVDFEEGVETFYSIDVVPAPLDGNTTYFWRVIPTTIYPTRAESRNRNESKLERADALTRGDATNSPVWRFTTGTTDVEEIHELPLLTELQRNYPNPFNPETTISFSLAEAVAVSITVYNSRGQQITTLINDNLAAGAHTVIWNGRDNKNREVGSGIYFYRMKSGSYTSTNKMILMK